MNETLQNVLVGLALLVGLYVAVKVFFALFPLLVVLGLAYVGYRVYQHNKVEIHDHINSLR